ncbi:PAS domain-containing protein [Brevibacillus massiliensis]|jgi:hypothetical protein|uniref:PAS domain-containing protein n=1 Tax=Brevibacillus massiliensis TaxID=1118054 RepID=UPI00030DBD4D|nr:PAS domain-containing protein [Brevibacillus massiliensis]
MLDASITLPPIRNAKGEVIGVAAITRDITERKKRKILSEIPTNYPSLASWRQESPAKSAIL